MSKKPAKKVTSRLKPNKPKVAAKPAARKPAAAKPKADKKSAKAETAAPKAASPMSTGISTQIDPQQQRLAIAHRDALALLQERTRKLSADTRNWGKRVKADGLTVRQIKLMIELATPEGEQACRLATANDLIAARYIGATIGEQLSLFLEPDRTPAVDRAYQEGRRASIEGKALRPPYDPATPQAESFAKGWHDETGERGRAGIKMPAEEAADPKAPTSTVIPKAEKDAAVTAKADKAGAAAAEGKTASLSPGAVTSRREFKDQQAAAASARETADSVFRKPAAGNA